MYVLFMYCYSYLKKKPTIKHIRKTKTKHNKTNKQTNEHGPNEKRKLNQSATYAILKVDIRFILNSTRGIK